MIITPSLYVCLYTIGSICAYFVENARIPKQSVSKGGGDFSMFGIDKRMDGNRDLNLPPTWEQFCSKEDTTNPAAAFSSYRCLIDSSSSGKWNFSELRNYISTKRIKYAFYVNCKNNAQISLPYNGKSRNIVKLHVRDCLATDYFADNQNSDLNQVPDELEEYVLINVQYVISLEALNKTLHSTPENLLKSAKCGDDETLKVRIERNESYSFTGQVRNASSFWSIASKSIIEERIYPHKCIYENLYLLEESLSPYKSRYFAEVLTEQNVFPELRILNISHCDIYYIPEQFKTWEIYFPKLEYLDMSNNRIQDIMFPEGTRAVSNLSIPLLTFDVTHNDISKLSVRILERIIQSKHLFVKIEHNPLNCSCTDDMKELLRYIRNTDWNSAKYSRYRYVRDLQCHSPDRVRGRRLKDLSSSDLNCDHDLVPIIVVLSVLICFLSLGIILILRFRPTIHNPCVDHSTKTNSK